MITMRQVIFFVIFCLFGCSDTVPSDADLGTAPRIADSSPADIELQIIDWTPPDAYVDPCENTTSAQDNFCDCHPECCQRQMWYCPPSGLGVQAAEITMNICNENLDICDRTVDLTCPPNEILSRGDCSTILECPPGIDNNIRITVRCEVEGVEGEQEILCRKGDIEYGECVICDPREERCNYQDDDCDGNIDEGQTNVCGTCGPLPADTCDGEDNDCDGQTDENLVRPCETPCNIGIEICETGNWVSCTARQPVEEQCDGEDNDCDSRVDEELECLCTVEDVGNLMPCFEAPLLCGQGFKTCECADAQCTEMRMTPCSALCSYLPQPQQECDPRIGIVLQQEECNNFDEDCDQNIDEMLTQACYTGPPDTLFVGVCQPGEVYCERGTWGSQTEAGDFLPGICSGEVTPQEEICNGADDDCDGVVDYGEQIRETDILFIVDWSGSMDDEIEAVKIALNRFATHFAAEEPLQWGLIVGPRENPNAIDQEFLVLVSDISPFDRFLADFAALGNEGMDTGNEMLLDAIYLSVRNISGNAPILLEDTVWWRNTGSIPLKEDFVINWRPTSERIVIVFSDEQEQSYLRDSNDPEGPSRPITEEVVKDAIRAAINLKVYTFSLGAGLPPRQPDWEEVALAGNGARFQLTSNALSMYNDLMSIIDEACLPREEDQSAENYMPNNYVPVLYHQYDFVNRLCY